MYALRTQAAGSSSRERIVPWDYVCASMPQQGNNVGVVYNRPGGEGFGGRGFTFLAQLPRSDLTMLPMLRNEMNYLAVIDSARSAGQVHDHQGLRQDRR